MENSKLTLRHLTSKKLSVKLKHGYTLNNFIREYNCSKEDFQKFLKKNFSEAACKRMFDRMEKNSKKTFSNHNSNEEILINSENVQNSFEPLTNNDEELEVLTASQSPASLNMKSENLKVLKAKEEQLRAEVISKETTHEALISKRRSLYKRLAKQKDLMLKLRELIKQRQKDVEEISQELIETSNELVALKASLASSKEELIEVKTNINELEKVSIFIYENGEIDTDDFLIDFPETWNDIFDFILHNKVVEDLSIKQIKQLAKLLILTNILIQSHLEYELIFESEPVQKAFFLLEKDF